MRVGLLIDRWDPKRGGAEAALDALAEFLIARGHEVHVFGAHLEGSCRGEFHAISSGGWTRGAREQRLGRGMIAAAKGVGCDVTLGIRHLERVDVLWLHGGSHRATLAARRRAAGRDPGRSERVVPRGRHRVFDTLERTALEGGAGAVVCPSRLVRDELLELYPGSAERLVLVENGVDLDRFHPRERDAARVRLRSGLGIEDDLPIVSFVARNPLLKGLPALLAATASIDRPFHLVISGPRRPRRWLRRARRRGLDLRRCHVIPWIDPLDSAAGADLRVHPTWRDISALAVLEAVACGTRVLASRYEGAAAGLRPEAVRIVQDPGDTAELRGALERELLLVEAGVDRSSVRASLEGRDIGLTLERIVEVLESGASARGKLSS